MAQHGQTWPNVAKYRRLRGKTARLASLLSASSSSRSGCEQNPEVRSKCLRRGRSTYLSHEAALAMFRARVTLLCLTQDRLAGQSAPINGATPCTYMILWRIRLTACSCRVALPRRPRTAPRAPPLAAGARANVPKHGQTWANMARHNGASYAAHYLVGQLVENHRELL